MGRTEDAMLPLVEKYRPRKVAEFIGISRAKAVARKVVSAPRPCALLFVGPPGVGKTTMGMALANELNAGLIHIRSQKCTAESVEHTWEDVHYYPPDDKKWWGVLCDEADQMSRAAQLALLSHLDSTANLTFDFGGAVRERKPLPVIWIFTANGEGYDSTVPPATFEPRFLSRCLQVPFKADGIRKALPEFLRRIWKSEGGNGKPDFESQFEEITSECQGSVRDALQELELRLMGAEFEEPAKEPARVEEGEPVNPVPDLALTSPKPARALSLPEMFRQSEEAFWKSRS
jgi:DNA polymerase III delta prime subunit